MQALLPVLHGARNTDLHRAFVPTRTARRPSTSGLPPPRASDVASRPRLALSRSLQPPDLPGDGPHWCHRFTTARGPTASAVGRLTVGGRCRPRVGRQESCPGVPAGETAATSPGSTIPPTVLAHAGRRRLSVQPLS